MHYQNNSFFSHPHYRCYTVEISDSFNFWSIGPFIAVGLILVTCKDSFEIFAILFASANLLFNLQLDIFIFFYFLGFLILM